VEEKLMRFIQSALEKIGVPHKDKVEELEERIEKLEKKLKR
jgi:polyhydroxyalkanoate synthesis regulator phasin